MEWRAVRHIVVSVKEWAVLLPIKLFRNCGSSKTSACGQSAVIKSHLNLEKSLPSLTVDTPTNM